MTTTAISCIRLARAGLLISLISLPFFINKRTIKKKCTVETTGTVVKYRYGGGDNGKSIAPIVEFFVDGKKYKAYRHYRGIVSKRKKALNPNEFLEQNNSFYISDKDIFHINTTGIYCNYEKIAKEVWPLGSALPVLYNPEKPKQAFVEKVVVISDIAGLVLLCTRCGLIAIAAIAYLLF